MALTDFRTISDVYFSNEVRSLQNHVLDSDLGDKNCSVLIYEETCDIFLGEWLNFWSFAKVRNGELARFGPEKISRLSLRVPELFSVVMFFWRPTVLFRIARDDPIPLFRIH